MMDKLLEALLNGGPLAVICGLLIWFLGRKLDRLTEVVLRLPEKISDQISRVMRQAKLLIVVGLLGAALSGCAGRGFEVCYVHPKYGTVCVEIDGTRHFKATLTAAEKEEVEHWIASGGK